MVTKRATTKVNVVQFNQENAGQSRAGISRRRGLIDDNGFITESRYKCLLEH